MSKLWVSQQEIVNSLLVLQKTLINVRNMEGEKMSEETTMIGDFEIPLDAVQTVVLPVGVGLTFEIKKSERKTYAEKDADTKQPTGRDLPYYNFQLSLPDYPGETVFHKYFLGAKNLSNRHADRSWKVFLDTIKQPYTTSPAENAMAGIRFVAQLREDVGRGEYVISKIISAA